MASLRGMASIQLALLGFHYYDYRLCGSHGAWLLGIDWDLDGGRCDVLFWHTVYYR